MPSPIRDVSIQHDTIELVAAENARLRAELADAKRSNENILAEWRIVRAELTKKYAELAALRPLAALGERALRKKWWLVHVYENGEEVFAMNRCCHIGQTIDLGLPLHIGQCEVPALLAQLEAKPDA